MSQQIVQPYEINSRGIRVSAPPVMAKWMQVQLEELFGEASDAGSSQRGPMSQPERSIGRIAKPPRKKQKFLMDMLETV